VILDDADPPTQLKFLEGIGAGAYGAVVKIESGGTLMAFKIFQAYQASGGRCRREVEIMNHLVQKGMPEVLKPLLGAKTYEFRADEYLYDGFAMELFPHPTIYEWLSSKVRKIKDPNERLALLLSPPIRKIYEKSLEAAKSMWSLGVIHRDLHAGNILVDEATETVKIIDFGKSFIPGKTQELDFQIGIRHDFLKFSVGFAASAMNPEQMGRSSGQDGKVLQVNKDAMCKLNPEGRIFLDAKMPQSPEWQRIYEAFREIHGITDGGKSVKASLKAYKSQMERGTSGDQARLKQLLTPSESSDEPPAAASPKKTPVVRPEPKRLVPVSQIGFLPPPVSQAGPSTLPEPPPPKRGDSDSSIPESQRSAVLLPPPVVPSDAGFTFAGLDRSPPPQRKTEPRYPGALIDSPKMHSQPGPSNQAGPSNSQDQQNKQVYKIMLEPERPPPSPIDAGENPRTIAVPPRREEEQTQRPNPRARAIDLEPPTSEMENMQVRSDSSSPAVFHLSMDSSPRKNPNDPRVSQSRHIKHSIKFVSFLPWVVPIVVFYCVVSCFWSLKKQNVLDSSNLLHEEL